MGNKHAVFRFPSSDVCPDKRNYTFHVHGMTEHQIQELIIKPLKDKHIGYSCNVKSQTIEVTYSMKDDSFTEVFATQNFWNVVDIPNMSPLETISKKSVAGGNVGYIG
jgi:hypothetical protein